MTDFIFSQLYGFNDFKLFVWNSAPYSSILIFDIKVEASICLSFLISSPSNSFETHESIFKKEKKRNKDALKHMRLTIKLLLIMT